MLHDARFDLGRRLALKVGAAAGVCALNALPARAESPLPKGQGKIIVPFPPGGPTDTLARMLADSFRSSLSTTYIVENRPGASGNIGAVAAMSGTADGLTLLLTNTQVVMNYFLFKHTKMVDPFRDLTPVTSLGRVIYGFAVPASTPENTLKAWIERMRKTNGGSYFSGGVGSTGHLFGHEFTTKAGLKSFEHIPYKGEAQPAQDLMGGSVQCGFLSAITAKPLFDAGRLKILAVTGESRTPLFPNVPTMAESGYRGFERGGWIGLLAPAKTPIQIRRIIAKATQDALNDSETTRRLTQVGYVLGASTPERFGEAIAVESKQQAERLLASGASLD